MVMEEKLVISKLELGKELANRLMSNLKHTSTSVDSNKTLISEILRIYENTIFMLSLNEDSNILKRSPEIDDKGSKTVLKKRKISEKKAETVKVFVATGQEHGAIDDGHYWRKYGQKEIHGYKNRRSYYRCTHRFTQHCLALKQVQKSDTDPSVYEVKHLGNHTCNNISSPKTTTNFSVSMFDEGNRVSITEQSKTEEVMINLEDLEKSKDILKTFSSPSYEIESGEWNSDIFISELFVEDLTPWTSGSENTSEIVSRPPASVEISETADSYLSSLDNIVDFGQDLLWSELLIAECNVS